MHPGLQSAASGSCPGLQVTRPQVEKVKAIKMIPQPLSEKEVNSFIELVGCYRFIPDLFTMVAPLTEMARNTLKKKKKFRGMQA